MIHSFNHRSACVPSQLDAIYHEFFGFQSSATRSQSMLKHVFSLLLPLDVFNLGKPWTDDAQGSTAPSDPPGDEPSAPASQRTAGGSHLPFMSLPVLNVLHCIQAGGRPHEHQLDAIKTLTGGRSRISEASVEP